MFGTQAVPQFGRSRSARSSGGASSPAGHEQLSRAMGGHGPGSGWRTSGWTPMRPGSVSSMREPSMSATKRPHSWILGLSPLAQSDGPRSTVLIPLVMARIRKGRGKPGERFAQAASVTMVSSSTARAAKEESWNPGTSRPTALVTRPSTREFVAMTGRCADITWTDHSQGRNVQPQEFKDDFLAGSAGPPPTSESPAPTISTLARRWCALSPSSARIDGPLGPFPPPGEKSSRCRCADGTFDSGGSVSGRDLLLRPGLAARAAGPDAAAVQRIDSFTSGTEAAPLRITGEGRPRCWDPRSAAISPAQSRPC